MSPLSGLHQVCRILYCVPRAAGIRTLLKEVFSTYLSTNLATLDIPDSVGRLA